MSCDVDRLGINNPVFSIPIQPSSVYTEQAELVGRLPVDRKPSGVTSV